MNVNKKISNICVYFLSILSLIITYRLYSHEESWPFIVVYWLIVTIKNVFDIFFTPNK